ncbi:hypothetical protein N3K66_008480 [Trichothecium roseum]|uniref:Uncharacterized protein n=1 Tax=Trichothecium roseum TaxID=47278 RepID=A0ACC0UQC8_9HYPO|nr:hypothetical protein N3K66_008480 [Trichothecium roseum]
MRTSTILAGTASALSAAALDVPSVDVPACPSHASISYTSPVPSTSAADFPLTQVDLCYTPTAISLSFTAHNETNFYFDPAQGTNDDIWEYEVMEAFIHKGTEDPQTYLEFEVSPNNVTYQAFIYNPSENRAEGAPFDHLFVSAPGEDGFASETTLDKEAQTWVSNVLIPLAFFNVKDGQAGGTEWRMQFLRTVVGPDTFPEQGLGAWSPPDEASFHITKFFGNVKFV